MVSKKRLCLMLCMVILMVSGCGRKEEIPELLEPVEVQLTGRIVERSDMGDIEVYAGSIKPYAVSYAFPDACRVKEIKVWPGQYVEAGQVLAVMDSSTYMKEREQLERELAWMEENDRYQEEIAAAEMEIMRLQTAMMAASSDHSTHARQALENREKEEEALQATYTYESEARQIDIEEKRNILQSFSEKTETQYLIAEEAGYVTYVKEFAADNAMGQVEAEEIIVMLSDKKQAYVAADIVDANVRRADRIYVEADGKQYELTYQPYSDQEKRLAINQGIQPEARLAAEDGNILAELIGKPAVVYLVGNQREQVLGVAPDSLFNENGEYFVYLIKDGAKVKQTVTPGTYSQNLIEITEGLQEGDCVYYPASDMPGNKHSLMALEKQPFIVEKSYDQVKVEQPLAARVLVEPEQAVLQEMTVTNGTRVEEGDTIAILSVDEGQSQKNSYRLELEELKISYEYEQMLDRKEESKLQERILQMQENETDGTHEYKRTVQELKILQLQMQMAENDYQYEKETLEQQLAREGTQTGRIEVKAPAAGIVAGMTSVAVGNTLEKDDLLCKIEQEASRCIMVYAEDEVIPMQSEVTVDLYQNEEDLKGSVIASYQDAMRTVYNNSRILKENIPQMTNVTYVALDNEADYEKVKSFGINRMIWNLQDAIVIPKEALYSENERRYVWVMKDDRMEKRYITIGHNSGKEIWVVQGLTAGEEIVLEN